MAWLETGQSGRVQRVRGELKPGPTHVTRNQTDQPGHTAAIPSAGSSDPRIISSFSFHLLHPRHEALPGFERLLAENWSQVTILGSWPPGTAFLKLDKPFIILHNTVGPSINLGLAIRVITEHGVASVQRP